MPRRHLKRVYPGSPDLNNPELVKNIRSVLHERPTKLPRVNLRAEDMTREELIAEVVTLRVEVKGLEEVLRRLLPVSR